MSYYLNMVNDISNSLSLKSQSEIFYYPHKNPSNHIHFYLGWIKNIRLQGYDMKLLYTCSDHKIIRNDDSMVSLKSKFSILDSFIVPIYLLKNNRYKKTIIILRRRMPFFLFLIKVFMKDLKIILDLEGFSKAEHDYLISKFNKLNFFKIVIHKINNLLKNDFLFKLSLYRSDLIIVVSNNFKTFLIKYYKLKSKKIFVFPTGVDTDEIFFDEEIRVKHRKKLNLEDRFVWIYAGNTLPWQNLDKLVSLFMKSWSKDKDNFLVLLLRNKKDQNFFKKLLLEAGVNESNFLITEASRDQMNNYLNLADLGLIYRENHLLNKFALPGKCGEYLMTGLSVLTSPYVGDYGKDIQKVGNGIIISDLDSEEVLLKKIIKFKKSNIWKDLDNRKMIAGLYFEKYSTNANIKSYCKMLDGLIKNG